MGWKITDEVVEEFLLRYLEGERIVDIAKELGVGKSTLYDLLKDDDIVKRLEKDRQYVQNQTRAMILKDASKYVNELKKIAINSSDVRSKLKANETLLAYIIGTPTNKVETTTIEQSNDSNIISQLYENSTNLETEDEE